MVGGVQDALAFAVVLDVHHLLREWCSGSEPAVDALRVRGSVELHVADLPGHPLGQVTGERRPVDHRGDLGIERVACPDQRGDRAELLHAHPRSIAQPCARFSPKPAALALKKIANLPIRPRTQYSPPHRRGDQHAHPDRP